MRTIIRRNNWRTLSDSEIEKLLPWMKIVHRKRMTEATALLLLFLIPALAIVAMHIFDHQWGDFLKAIWIFILAGFFIFVAVCSIVDYALKMKKFKNGEFQVVNVNVTLKGIGSGSRRPFYSIRVNGLFENDKNIEKQFRVPKAIYDLVSDGDRALAVRYNGYNAKKPFSDLDFLPCIEK